MECVDFGQTGLRVSRLSFGTGSNSEPTYSEQTKLGLDGLANLLRAAYDHGVTFWDSAHQYGSHPHVARAPPHRQIGNHCAPCLVKNLG